ncbi:MAG: hypothetical protein R3F46_01525 [bacterium]
MRIPILMLLVLLLASCSAGRTPLASDSEPGPSLLEDIAIASRSGFRLIPQPGMQGLYDRAEFSLEVEQDAEQGYSVEVRMEGADIRAALFTLELPDSALQLFTHTTPVLPVAGSQPQLQLVRQAGQALHCGVVLPNPDESTGANGSFVLTRLSFRSGQGAADVTRRISSVENAAAQDLYIDIPAGMLSFDLDFTGDYDQNGEVNISDLVQLGRNFQKSGPFPADSVESVVDGDGNSEINLADITPIGVHFGKRLSGWRIQGGKRADWAQPGAGTELAEIPFSALTGSPEAERLHFEGSVDGLQGFGGESAWLVPFNDEGEGPAGERRDFGVFIEIRQNSYLLDGVATPFSNWGKVFLDYPTDPASKVLQFSLQLNGRSVIGNLPLRSGGQPGERHQIAIPVDLDIVSGTQLTSVEYAYSLGTDKLASALSDPLTAEVGSNAVVIDSGEDDEQLQLTAEDLPPTWFLEIGGELLDSGFLPTSTIVNQQCGKRECAPAAVSNSLQMLSRINPTINQDLDFSIEEMKKPTQWDKGATGGAPDSPDAWWNSKKQWMEDNEDYPVSTEIVYEKTEIDRVLQDIKNGRDVELRVPGHVVLLTGIAKFAGSRYALEMAHDENQADPESGLVRELAAFDADTCTFRGEAWINGKELSDGSGDGALFVVEDFTNRPRPVSTWKIDITDLLPDPSDPGPIGDGHNGKAKLIDNDTGETVGSIPYTFGDPGALPGSERIRWDWNPDDPFSPVIIFDNQSGSDLPYLRFDASLLEPAVQDWVRGVLGMSFGISHASNLSPGLGSGYVDIDDDAGNLLGQVLIGRVDVPAGGDPEAVIAEYILPRPDLTITINTTPFSIIEVVESQVIVSLDETKQP